MISVNLCFSETEKDEGGEGRGRQEGGRGDKKDTILASQISLSLSNTHTHTGAEVLAKGNGSNGLYSKPLDTYE